MSLLLDALKKAAEQKLQKEASGEAQADSVHDTSASSATKTTLDFTVSDEEPAKTAYDYEEDVTKAGLAQHTDKTDFLKEDDTQLGQDDWSLEDATAFEMAHDNGLTSFSEIDSEIDMGSAHQASGDTIVDDTALGVGGADTDTGGLKREWQALSGDGDHAAENEMHSSEFEHVRQQTVSLTKNIENERASFDSSAHQAAYMFANKRPDAGGQKRRLTLYIVVVCGIFTLGGLYGYDYLLTITDDSASYRPIRPSRPMQLEPGLSEQMDTVVDDESLVDADLLVEQEDYANLLGDEDAASSGGTDAAEPVRQEKLNKVVAASKPAIKQQRRTAVSRPAIQIAKQTRKPPLQEVLLQAYDAYQTGNTVEAQSLYQNAIARDGNSRDALLGLAALSLQARQFEQAGKYYQRILYMDPRDTYAIAGLVAVKSGQATRGGLNESQLKQLLSEKPEAHELHFSLGNLYVREKKWSLAQKAYFSAYRLESNNPDYLFNLAISLDHLGQARTAKQFYAQALTAANTRASHFDLNVARKRLQDLSAMNTE